MGSGPPEQREPAEVRADHVDLAEDAGLLIGDPGRVEVGGVLWGEEVPALPVGDQTHL